MRLEAVSRERMGRPLRRLRKEYPDSSLQHMLIKSFLSYIFQQAWDIAIDLQQADPGADLAAALASCSTGIHEQ